MPDFTQGGYTSRVDPSGNPVFEQPPEGVVAPDERVLSDAVLMQHLVRIGPGDI